MSEYLNDEDKKILTAINYLSEVHAQNGLLKLLDRISKESEKTFEDTWKFIEMKNKLE